MRVLFDHGTPVSLGKQRLPHQVETAYERSWSSLKNGELLSEAEANGFDVLITTDQNLKYQQNLSGRRIAIVVINTTSWPRIRRAVSTIIEAVESALPGSYAEVPILK